jgi:transcriptional regulator with XRE-family HTH domain
MTAERPLWAARLRAERNKRLWSQKETAVQLRNAADEHVRARLPSISSLQRYVRAYEAGKNHPGDRYVELYCRAFGRSREYLFGSASEGAGQERLPTVQDVASFTAWINATNTTDAAIDRIFEAAHQLAEAHTREPPRRVLANVMLLHRQVQTLLREGRQHLRQTRDLFRVDADLLAHASILLGDIHRDGTASVHGAAAVLCADEAGSSRALGLSAQAKVARWRGAHLRGKEGQRYYALSADQARQGYECAPRAPARVLLANQEASAAALLGDVSRARQALRRAEEAAEGSSGFSDSGWSAWSCPRPRQALYALSVSIRLGDAHAARRSAEMADAGWVAGDPWLYGVWSLIRIGAGIAEIMKGDLDGARAQVAPVLTLPNEFRIATITGYLADMDARLKRRRRFAGVAGARDLREQIRIFTAGAAGKCHDGSENP